MKRLTDAPTKAPPAVHGETQEADPRPEFLPKGTDRFAHPPLRATGLLGQVSEKLDEPHTQFVGHRLKPTDPRVAASPLPVPHQGPAHVQATSEITQGPTPAQSPGAYAITNRRGTRHDDCVTRLHVTGQAKSEPFTRAIGYKADMTEKLQKRQYPVKPWLPAVLHERFANGRDTDGKPWTLRSVAIAIGENPDGGAPSTIGRLLKGYGASNLYTLQVCALFGVNPDVRPELVAHVEKLEQLRDRGDNVMDAVLEAMDILSRIADDKNALDQAMRVLRSIVR
jgi:hypothetical protein